jgi:hypothetical protein
MRERFKSVACFDGSFSMITNTAMTQLLIDNGCQNWALTNEVLIVWDNDEDPPAPLTRPEATDETPSPD